MKRFLPDRLTLLSGLLVVAAFPPWDFDFLIWFALVPWFAALARTPSLRAAAREGVWLSFLLTVGGFYWIARVLHQFGNLPWSLSILALLLFAGFGQLQLSTFAPLFRLTCAEALASEGTKARSGRAILTWALLITAVYVGIDWFLPKLFADTMGHAFYRARWIRQSAELGSAWLLTYLVIFVNLALWILGTRLRHRTEPSARPALAGALPTLVTAALFVAACLGFGKWRIAQVEKREAAPEDKLQIALIQANIGDFDKIAAEQGVRSAANKIINAYFDMSDSALAMSPRPDAVVWPETAYPSTFRHPQTSNELARDQSVEAWVHERQTPLLFGGYDTEARKDYNAIFFLSPTPMPGLPSPGDLQIYRKYVLLLFGEYIPGAEHFEFIKNSFPQVGNFGRGAGPSVLLIPRAGKSPVPVNPLICYEVLFPNLVAEGARKGGRAMLNITNDSWFGEWAEPQLHLALSTFRTIEARIPLIRATNTGISALVLPNGDITNASEISKAEVLNMTVPLIAPMDTLVKRWGDWFGPTMFLVGIFSCIAWVWGKRKRSLRTAAP